MPAKILVVEDEPALAKLISYNLVQAGYAVVTAGTGYEGLAAAKREQPDLVLLDVMLPDIDGFDVCRELRRESRVPIVFLTARGEEIDRVLGLELGADDYVTKPFSPRELVARVRAHLRRVAEALAAGSAQPADSVIRIDGLLVDLAAVEARLDGKELTLTPIEFRLLEHLVRNRGRALTREQLLNAVWGEDYYGDERVVDVHISHLRERIDNDADRRPYIETVRGVGYRVRGDRK